eukprot:g27262.t1
MPLFWGHSHSHHPAQLPQEDASNAQEQFDSVMIDEVKVKALQSAQLKKNDTQQQETAPVISTRSTLLKAVTEPQACCAALAKLQQTQVSAKPATEIMRPLVFTILQESEEGDLEDETSVRVFETLAKRAELLVDSLTKSSAEFWKVWTTFYPALVDFSESSPIFESALFFFKRLGEQMRESDPQLTQQLMNEVALSSLAKELSRSPEKREDTLNHVLALRSLKEKVGDDMSVYVSCLAGLVQLDGQANLLDEHLLDLYIYYALIAMQSAQPRTRVAGLSILCSITQWASHESVVALLPNFFALCNDEWWEVQAQLLRLSARLLQRLASERGEGGHEGVRNEDGTASGASKPEEAEATVETMIEDVLNMVGRLFVVSNSKNVLQVGLSGLVHVLQDYPNLLPNFVAVLLGQSPEYRRRLLDEAADSESLACGAETLALKSRESSRQCFIEALGRLYTEPAEHVEEASILVFLRELRNFNEDVQAEVDNLLDAFMEEYPDESLACGQTWVSVGRFPGSPEADITSTHPRRDTTPCRSASHVSMERFLVRKRPRTEGAGDNCTLPNEVQAEQHTEKPDVNGGALDDPEKDVLCLQEVRLPAAGPKGCKRGDGQKRRRSEVKGDSAQEKADWDVVQKTLIATFGAQYAFHWSLADWKYSGTLVMIRRSLRSAIPRVE